MQICNFIESELEEIRKKANFSVEELAFFNFRAKNKSLIEISLEMNVSERTADRMSARVKKKIIKII